MWSPEDGEYVGLCAEFPSLSWLAKSPESALSGIQKLVAATLTEMRSNGEELPLFL
jgi:predicted RNase H-like HicB family nuclease